MVVFDKQKIFGWANLRKVLLWNEVKKVIDLLLKKNLLLAFNKFSLISNYKTAQKIKDWNTGKKGTENHWMEVLTHYRKSAK